MKKDLEEYLLNLEKQHQEMKKSADEATQLLKEGKISQEQASQILAYMTNIDINYNRVLYCRYLANLPPKFIQKIQEKKLKKKMEKFKQEHADEESVVQENQEDLNNMSNVVKEEDVDNE